MLTPLLHEAEEVIQKLFPLGVRVQFIELQAEWDGQWARGAVPTSGEGAMMLGWWGSNRDSASPTPPKLQTMLTFSTTSRGH